MNTTTLCCEICRYGQIVGSFSAGDLRRECSNPSCYCHSVSQEKECEHDYENAVRKGRAKYECPKCGEDISLSWYLMQEAIASSQEQVSGLEKELTPVFHRFYANTTKNYISKEQQRDILETVRTLLTTEHASLRAKVEGMKERETCDTEAEFGYHTKECWDDCMCAKHFNRGLNSVLALIDESVWKMDG